MSATKAKSLKEQSVDFGKKAKAPKAPADEPDKESQPVDKTPSKAEKGDKEKKSSKKDKSKTPEPAAAPEAKDSGKANDSGKKSKKSEPKPAESEEPAEKSGKKKSEKKKSKTEEPAEAEPEVVSEEPKKKKKKKSAPDLEAEAASEATEQPAEPEVAAEEPKKKKKKKAPKPEEEAPAEEATAEPAADEKPKKKKKSKKPAEEEPEPEAEEAKEETEDVEAEDVEEKVEDDEVVDDDDLDLSLKKKKKKKPKKADGDEIVEKKVGTGVDPWAGSDRDYNYTELLDRVFSLLREKNPNLAVKKRHVMPPPQLVRVGTKKTMWTNFQIICQLLHRQPEHLHSFVLAELGTEGSIDGNQRMVIKGRYAPKQMESLLKKYITEYVMCSICRNPETTLTRDSVTRLYFIQCESCGSRRSVAPIKSGFHAQMKSDRKKIKDAS